jgi:hypothetical protein
MEPGRNPRIPLERRLRILAREFRGTKNERVTIAQIYAEAVVQLINGKKWKNIPALEDQLPDEWMPEQFFTYWSLQPPVRRAGRTG